MGRPRQHRSGSGGSGSGGSGSSAPAPRIELIGLAPSATPVEAAAVVAALERFLAETRPAAASAASKIDPWRRAALLEGVDREPLEDLREPWI